MKFFNLRGDVVKALAAEDAYRSHELAIRDDFHRAIRSNDLAASLQLHCGYEEPIEEIAMALGDMARNDHSMRSLVNFVGGPNAEPWNHWEWSLPPSMIPAAKKVLVNG